MKTNSKILSLVTACTLIIVGCGGSDEKTPTKTPNSKDKAPIKVTSSGVITGFGSVYVNGTRYITETSNIINNGTSGAEESSLKVGMRVIVSADKPTDGSAPIAEEVKYVADVAGQIQAIDLVNSSLTVLGQSYLVTNNTKFDSLLFKELTTEMFVEISAIKNELDQYLVNYIEVENDPKARQLVGEISTLDSTAMTFAIGDLVIDYNGAQLKGTLVDGASVEVKTSQALVDNVFLADEVEVEETTLISGEEIAISGVINLIEGDKFILEEQSFMLTADTVFTQGSKEDITAGSQVSLVATVTDTDSLNVNNIRIELASELSIEALVEAISENSYTLLGQEFYVDEYTQFEDDSDLKLRNFNFTDISIGDLLEIDVFDNEGKLVSRSIEREQVGANANEVQVEGKVDNIEPSKFSIKGIIIASNEQTVFENVQGDNVTQAEFFELVKLDDTVEAELSLMDGKLLALEIEIENDNTQKNSQVELVGRIDSFESVNVFTLNGFEVLTTAETVYKKGAASDLALDTKFEIEGRVNEFGQIVAKEIELISQ